MKTKKKVNVLAFGDFLDTLKGPQAVSAIGGLTSLLGSSASNLSVPDTYVPNTKAGSVEELLDLYGQGAPQISTTNVGKSSLTGVAEGAAAGAAFGPWGAAIGGAAGGLANLATSLIGNKKIQRRNLQLQQEQTNNLDAARQALEEKNFNTQMSTIFANGGDLNVFAKGGGIHINPANKGKFTATKKRTGKSTEELTHSKNPLTRKRAIFAQNSRRWSHSKAFGGYLEGQEYDLSREEIKRLEGLGYDLEY